MRCNLNMSPILSHVLFNDVQLSAKVCSPPSFSYKKHAIFQDLKKRLFPAKQNKNLR